MPMRLLAAVVLLLPLVLGADWSRFRGPGGSGQSDATQLPTVWDAQSGVRWKRALPGPGGSSPIVVGSRVYVTSYTGYGLDEEKPGDETALTRHVLGFDLDRGEPAWNTPFPTTGSERPYQGFQTQHGFASSTLTTDGESLFLFFGRSGVGSVSLDGKPQWQQSVGTGINGWGSGASPVLYKNLVIVNACVESESLVALDRRTGREVWRADGIRAAWNTPVVAEGPDGAAELILSIQNRIVAFDPATGQSLWSCDGIRDYICPSVIVQDGVVYALGARKSAAVAVRMGGRGDVTETHRLWKIGKGSNVSSPVYHDGHLYWVHESRGIAYCVRADSGDVAYEARLSPRPGRVYASPVVADGKIYVVSRTRGTYVLAARPEFELLAHNEPLDDSVFNGSPAVVDGTLLIRSDKNLYRIGPSHP